METKSQSRCKQMIWAEFAGAYCERQEQTPKGLAEVLRENAGKFRADGFFLLECHMLGGSRLGEYTILPYGGDATYKTIPAHPVSPRGLASDMSVAVGWIPVNEIPKEG